MSRNLPQIAYGSLFSLAGRVACVTGASSGIGRAMATALAESGARVVGVARRAERLADWQAETQGETAMVEMDLADLDTVPAAARMIEARFEETPDILVNAAGVNLRQPAAQVTAESWRQTLDLNLSVPFLMAQTLAPGMAARGWGRIINIASLQSARALPGGIAYGASKGGIAQLTRAMAAEWGTDGITANAIAPGFFPTELTAPVFADARTATHHASATCIGRNGRMEDLVGPLLFLCSRASDYVTGQLLAVDGGYTAK
ncbi:MAG: SDR family oxidoreductase [Pseudomonadota bacterium]